MTTGRALAIGTYSDHERAAMSRASRRGGVSLAFHDTISAATASLRSKAATPRCVLVSAGFDLEPLVDFVRDRATLFSLPIVAVADRPGAEDYGRAYRAGVDDVWLRDDLGGLTRRMANLADYDASWRPPEVQGCAAVISDSEVFRKRIGRTLRQVGFEVRYCTSLAEISKVDASIVFAVTSLNEGGAGEIPLLRLGSDELGDEEIDLTGRLLFFADEQRARDFVERRETPRLLFSVMCSFREQGDFQLNVGVTHNVSEGGLYIRTLDPPRPASTVWLELATPAGGRAVHLRGEVAWRRLPGSHVGILPPGFGVRLLPEQCPPGDLEAFLTGCRSLGRVKKAAS